MSYHETKVPNSFSFFLLIDSVTLKNNMGKCVCIYFMDDLKLNHGRV